MQRPPQLPSGADVDPEPSAPGGSRVWVIGQSQFREVHHGQRSDACLVVTDCGQQLHPVALFTSQPRDIPVCWYCRQGKPRSTPPLHDGGDDDQQV